MCGVVKEQTEKQEGEPEASNQRQHPAETRMQPSKGNHIAGTFQLTFLVKHVSKDQKYDCDNAVQSDQQASAHMNLFQCGKIFIHGPGQGYVIQQIHKWRKYRVSGLCQPITYLITKDSHAITHGGNDQCGNGFNSNIQKMNLPPEVFCIEGKPNIFFRPFNLHENLARQLWSLYAADCERRYDPLDYRPISITQQPDGSWSATSQDYVHLVIVGFNRVGRSLLLEALRICHYANYDDRLPADERIRTRITLVDREMEAQEDYFKAQFPYIENQIDDIEVEYCHDDICSTAMRTRLQQWAQNKHCMLTVAICVHDPDLSLSLGLNLPHEVYQYQCRVLIRQEFNNDLSSMVDDEKGRYRYVKVFGMVDRGIKKNILQDKLALYVNYLYDCCYADESLKQKEVLKKMYESYGNHSADFILMNHQAQYLWNKLSEPLRWANRYQLDAYSVFCRTLGYGIRRSNCSPTHISESMFNEELPAQVLYLLVRMEKYRWNAERTVAGWKRAKVKDKVFLLHPLIMPFSELLQRHPEEVEKDADVIYNLPYILALGGYELYRLADQ
jgi:hypothetical protein